MVSENSISVVIAALDEEENLESAVMTVLEAVKRTFDEYELIIFNDGSTDRTAEVADKLAERDENTMVIHHKKPRCLGGVYKEGIKLAKMNYLMLVSGKNDTTLESLNRIFSSRGKADMIISYVTNDRERPMLRRISSQAFVSSLNMMFRMRLRYYNHYVLHKRTILNSINIRTNSYAYQAEALIKLIKSGYSYVEIGVESPCEKGVKSKVFAPRNLFGVLLFFFRMIKEYRKSKSGVS